MKDDAPTGLSALTWGVYDGYDNATAGFDYGDKDGVDIILPSEAMSGASIMVTTCLFVLAGDLNDDCKVDFMDLKVLPEQWLQPPGLPSADIWPSGGDDMVNFEDFSVMAESWLIDCQANPANPACVPK